MTTDLEAQETLDATLRYFHYRLPPAMKDTPAIWKGRWDAPDICYIEIKQCGQTVLEAIANWLTEMGALFVALSKNTGKSLWWGPSSWASWIWWKHPPTIKSRTHDGRAFWEISGAAVFPKELD